MPRRELSDEELNQIIKARQTGASWLKIQRETGIHRQTAKRAYERWVRSKSMEELKEARRDVAAQAFREHVDSLVTLATSLVMNLDVTLSPDIIDENAEQFFSRLFEGDLLLRETYVSLEGRAYVPSAPRPIVDRRSYYREKVLLFESLKTHTREAVRWEDVLENRWKKTRDNCAQIVLTLQKETKELVKNYLKQEQQEQQADLYLLRSIKEIKEVSGVNDPVEQMAEAVLWALWQDILQDKLCQEGPRFERFETVWRTSGGGHTVYVKPRGKAVLGFAENTGKNLVEKVTRICDLTYDSLRRGDMVQELRREAREMKKAAEELREALNPVKLRPMIIRTRCDLCPA